MLVSEAIIMLGLCPEAALDQHEVVKAYKKLMLEHHPDKNSSPDSHLKSSLLNDAKEVLMESCRAGDVEAESVRCGISNQAPVRSAEDERVDQENVMKIREWTVKMEDATDGERAEFLEWFVDTCRFYNDVKDLARSGVWGAEYAEYYEKVRAMARRKRYAVNRRRRPVGSRVHRKIGEYQEGRRLLEKISGFLRECVVEAPGSCIVARELFDRLVGSQAGISRQERHMMLRHYGPVLVEQFQGAKVVRKKNKRCFQNLAWKTGAD